MSRQRVYQLKNQALGLCIICPTYAVNKTHCARHRDAKNILAVEARKKLKVAKGL